MFVTHPIVVLLAALFSLVNGHSEEIEKQSGNKSYYSLEGKVYTPPEVESSDSFLSKTRVIANNGEFLGFVGSDGSFSISKLSPGSYIVEVTNPDFFFEPVRVDINSKGKIRARKVNYIQTSAVNQVNYPLKFKAKSQFKYFQIRESWKITDFLFNPMVLMMVLPLLLIMVLPKMINSADPETQREMQNMQMPKYDMPELSEVMTSFFKGSSQKEAASTSRKATKTKRQ